MHFTELLDPARVAIGVDLSDKRAVLERMAELIASADPELSSAVILQSLLARENLGSTGLGHGIAIPHGRSAAQRGAIVACIITRAPLDYDAIDNQPVDIFVGLSVAAAATSEHLVLLAEIAERLSQDELRRALRQAPDAASAYRLLAAGGTGAH